MEEKKQLIEVGEYPSELFGSTSTTYQFTVNGENPQIIGTVFLVHGEGLSMAFNIPPGFHGLGIGKRAFELAEAKYSATNELKYISASWRVELEYGHLEGSASTNLTVFNAGLMAGMSESAAALATPTGKWASQLGYGQVEMLRAFESLVEVNFWKVLPVPTEQVKDEEDDFWPEL